MFLNVILGLLGRLALPALLTLLKVILTSLEVKYPGIKPLVDAILKFLDGGGNAEQVLSHCESMPDFCPMDLKRD
jgi:hypothetical protein